MKGLRRFLALLPLVLGTPAVADPALAPTDAPYAAVRALQSLQDRVARGDREAQAEQADTMAHIADVFRAAETATWRDARNTRAAVLFLLSGGKPTVMREVLSRAEMAPDLDRLLKGALAYGEGQDGVARSLLGPVDPRSLPSSLGGQVALIQASLFAGSDPAKASRALDQARLLMPGTLVEEAALRRQITLLEAPEAADKFILVARQYFHRYRSSVYAGNFRQRFTAVAVHLAETGDVVRLGKLEPVMADIPARDRRRLYFAMAKAALSAGRTEAARFAASRAAGASDDPSDVARARLYDAAALVASDRVADGLAMLNEIEAGRLSSEDATLREAAVAVGETVRAPVPPPPASLPRDSADAAPADTTSALIARAQDAATASSKLLQAAP